MTIADILSDIGKGAEAVGKATVPILQRTSEVVSGEAPQIDAESRKRAEQLEDEQINAKAQVLENNLALGQKYGTLTPDQQQQYVDAISGLYNKPRHAQVLMDKLRKAIHPNGMVAQAPQPALANPTPQGGTAKTDAELAAEKQHPRPVPGVHPFKGPDGKYYQPMYDAYGNILNEEVQGYTPPEAKGGGKSPPVTGDQLPQDAVGVNGDPIPPDQRNAGKSFVEYQGKWWAVAPPKPKLTTLRGHTVLMDANGKVLRDLGEKDSVKVTRRQTLQPGDDGEMHLVTLTSVTTPEGATIDVDPETDQEKQEMQESPNSHSSTQPKTPAKKVNPGSLIPKTGVKSSSSSGPVVPGLRTLAASKNPVFKADVAQYTKAAEDANNKMEAYQSAQRALASGPTASSDQELIYSWVRSNVQGAGRMTQAEFRQSASIGSLPQRAQIAWNRIKTGKLPPEIEQMFLADIRRAAETSAEEADRLRKNLGSSGNNLPLPSSSTPPNNDPLGVL